MIHPGVRNGNNNISLNGEIFGLAETITVGNGTETHWNYIVEPILVDTKSGIRPQAFRDDLKSSRKGLDFVSSVTPRDHDGGLAVGGRRDPDEPIPSIRIIRNYREGLSFKKPLNLLLALFMRILYESMPTHHSERTW
jgi:hypothetical protein